MESVRLIGLDFGTTTSSAVIASARLLRNAVTGRVEVTDIAEQFRSDIVFTPLCGDRLDEERIAAYLDAWLSHGADSQPTFGGGALLTGLTAQRDNAQALVRLIRERVRNTLIASASDPCMESWLAFMGNCAGLSRQHQGTLFLNLDIGGGTTNLALGRNGEVLATGCLFVGARHVEVVPGTYRLVKLSRYARELFRHLGIERGLGDELHTEEINTILDFQVRLLEAAVLGQTEVFDEPTAALHQQVPYRVLPGEKVVLTLSGGVGELVYAALQGKPLPTTTSFGDLGIDLAERLLREPSWADDLRQFLPPGGGRATVYGLLRHSTQVSGSTIFLADPSMLPLADVPIVGTVDVSSTDSEIGTMVDLVRRSDKGGCLRVRLRDRSSTGVRELAGRISRILETQGFPARHPLVLLVPENIGKVLGHYVTRWGALPLALIVIDEIDLRDAHYVHVGTPQDQVIPVSFHGLET